MPVGTDIMEDIALSIKRVAERGGASEYRWPDGDFMVTVKITGVRKTDKEHE